jgi:hypothetical protein
VSAHTAPANCRCLWCRRLFCTVDEANTHMHLMHRANIVRTPEQQAQAKLQHYHADREAVRKGGVLPENSTNNPRGAGRALAERMRGVSTPAFLAEMDEILDHMKEEMLASGRPAPIAYLICREIRQAARQEWHRREAPGAAIHGC